MATRDDEDDTHSLSEMLSGPPKEALKRVYGVDRQEWGRWKLDSEHDVLAYSGDPDHPSLDYWIPLAEMNSGEKIFDWIRQVQGKTWLSEQELGHFVRATFAILLHQSILKESPAVRRESDFELSENEPHENHSDSF